MTAASPAVEMRWLPGLAASCPGAVDLAMVGPLGRIERAVTFPEALTMSVVVDLLCPSSNLSETLTELAAQAASGRET